MTALDQKTLTELIDLLTPLMTDKEERKALLTQALTGASALAGIDYSGPADAFVTMLIGKLVAYGQVERGTQALWALLETMSAKVGVDKQDRIEALKVVANAPDLKLAPTAIPQPGPPPAAGTVITISGAPGAKAVVGNYNAVDGTLTVNRKDED